MNSKQRRIVKRKMARALRVLDRTELTKVYGNDARKRGFLHSIPCAASEKNGKLVEELIDGRAR